MNNSLHQNITKITVNVLLLIFSFSTLFPLIWVFYNSLKAEPEFIRSVFSLPTEINITNYISILQNKDFFIVLWNSFFNSAVSTIFVIFMGYTMGFILARYKFKGSNILRIFFVSGMLIPIPAILVPLFLQFKAMGLYNHRLSLIIPFISFNLSLAIFLFESYVKTIPKTLDEAAMVDGAILYNVIYRIIFPICQPMVATVGVLTFLFTWNQYVFPLILIRSRALITIPLWLASTFKGQYEIMYTKMMTGMLLSTLPVIIIYIIFRRQIMDGLTVGAVKG